MNRQDVKTIKWAVCALLICVAQSVWAEKTAQAIWCSGNKTLYFINSETVYAAGGSYNNQTITSVWSGDDVTNATNGPGWDNILNLKNECTTVVFDDSFADVRPTSCLRWFQDFMQLTSIEGLTRLNTSEVTNMNGMFANCIKLTSIDLTGFRTANVTNMEAMFYRCKVLTSLDLSTFRTNNVTNMGQMFSGCSALTTIYVSNGWTTAHVTSSSGMFDGCPNNGNYTTKVPTVVLNDNADNAAEIGYFKGITANVKL